MSKEPSVVTASEQSPLLGPAYNPSPQITHGGKPVPQTIGHRGFKAAAPENTMASFKAATEAGVDALETDLHLTRDGVVVLCHDETLQRCYGKKARVRDLDWSEISQLRTLREPHLPMPRLIDLLEYLDQPGLQNIWLMLDIKTDDDAEEMMQRTAAALGSVSSKRPWNTRVTPCCWNVIYIKFCMKYLPDYHITHLGFSTTTARHLIDIPNISFSIIQYAIASPSGGRFLKDMKGLGIAVYVWTVNEESWMEWSVQKELTGVITDEVALFHEVCNRMGNGDTQIQTSDKSRKKAGGLRSWFLYRKAQFLGEMAIFYLLVAMLSAREWVKYGSPSHHISKALNS
ncbi:hypothetical protein CHU98_g9111 [Xylaria longipes]|nr:hypothetical protein CHU98_g9111 [Xylaria longipes]